ncbi:alpha/beta hydrolase [Saccharothrix syringae]|uniref:alpha/beta hydrolase n=1 Tax=Saccharothrix syringae TaxID=103733 RepID=UPI000526CB99|nr:alpha/beta hydrolase [Saccharothrix syringae]
MTAELDRQYSPSTRVPSLRRYLDEYAVASAAARDGHEVRVARYGPGPDELVDLFPGPAGGPLLVFVHGGNWQALGRADSAFGAPGALAAGASFAAVDYPLAPGAALDDIVSAVRRCVHWLHANAERLGFHPRRIHLCGTSAGAHLAAMTAVDPACPPLAGLVLLSGMYDLEPVRRSYVNDALGLDFAGARRNSPIWWLPERLPPVIAAVGDNETEEYHRQHALLVAALAWRAPLTSFVVAGRNHFDLPYDLTDPGTALGGAVLTAMEETT